MALSFDITTSEAIEFEDFIAYAEKEIDRHEPEGLLNCREVLQKLTNNDHFVTDFINRKLTSPDTFQKDNSHSIQSLMLHFNRNFYIRLNAWPVLSSRPDVRDWQEYL